MSSPGFLGDRVRWIPLRDGGCGLDPTDRSVRSGDDHSLTEHASRLRARADDEEFNAHASELARIVDRPDVLATGISAAETAGLLGGSSAVEIYAPAAHREAFIDEHALEPGPGPVRIRWVRDEIWPLLDQDDDRRAPRAAVLVDLLEHDDPRARREAARALEP